MNQPVLLAVVLSIIAVKHVAAADAETNQADDRIQSLVKQLQHGDDEERRLAARELCDLQPRDATAIKALGKATRDRDQQVYSRSAEALARLGPDAAPAINFLIDRLEDRDQQRRYRASYALGRMGAESVPALQKIINAGAGRYRVAAAIDSLAWSGEHAKPVIPDLIKALASSNESVANAASQTLGHLGSIAGGELLQATTSDNPQVRRLAASAVGQIENASADWAPSIAKLMTDREVEVRVTATRAFSLVARHAEQIECTPLTDRLADDDVNVRQAAGQGVIRLRRCWSSALPNVERMLDMTPQDVEIAAHVIERMGPLASAAIETLLTTIEKRPDMRGPVTMALSQIGPELINPVVAAVRDNRIDVETGQHIVRFAGGEPLLIQHLEDGNLQERIIAARMLGAAEPVQQSSIDCLMKGTTDDAAEVRLACVLGLGSMGTAAKSAEPAIRETAAKDPSEEVQAAALTTLFKIGVDPSSLVDAIVAGLKNPNDDIRRECARAMNRFEALDSNQTSALVATLVDNDVIVRTNVVRAIANAAEPSEELVTQVVGVLDDRNHDVRSAAFETLATFGAGSESAVPTLISLLDEGSTRLASLTTLAAIGKSADPAAGAVKTLVGDASPEVRSTSLETLAKIMSNRSELIAILSDRLADDDWAVRKQSATLLGSEGKDAVSAVPALITLLQNEKDSDYARNALRGIDAAPPEAVPQLVAILAGDSGRRARYYAMHLLKKVGPAAKQAVPELQAILDQEKYDSRTQRYLKQVIEEIEDQDSE